MTGRGRRPGNPDTRESVLAAARRSFADRGFDGTTVRGVARAAGVDPSLVHHYFGSKDELFAAAVRLPFNPVDILRDVARLPPDERGEAVVRTLLGVWDSPAGEAGVALFRSVVADPAHAGPMREFILGHALYALTEGLGLTPAERARRTSLAATQLVGLILARYVVRLDPVAHAPADELAATIGPTVQRYLTGPLGGETPGAPGAGNGTVG